MELLNYNKLDGNLYVKVSNRLKLLSRNTDKYDGYDFTDSIIEIIKYF